jgi:FeS assembly SUF system protein
MTESAGNASELQATGSQAAASAPPVLDPSQLTTEQLKHRCVEACRSVYDPEIPVNIYELGLIYEVAVDEQRNVKVRMTLTSPACPAAQELPLEVRGRIAVIPGVNDVEVDVVFDPPWSPANMSEAAKVQMGMEL